MGGRILIDFFISSSGALIRLRFFFFLYLQGGTFYFHISSLPGKCKKTPKTRCQNAVTPATKFGLLCTELPRRDTANPGAMWAYTKASSTGRA